MHAHTAPGPAPPLWLPRTATRACAAPLPLLQVREVRPLEAVSPDGTPLVALEFADMADADALTGEEGGGGVPIALITGAAGGSLVVLAIACLGCLMIRRRRQPKRLPRANDPIFQSHPTTSPLAPPEDTAAATTNQIEPMHMAVSIDKGGKRKTKSPKTRRKAKDAGSPHRCVSSAADEAESFVPMWHADEGEPTDVEDLQMRI